MAETPTEHPRLRPDLAVIPMSGGVQLRAGDEEIYFLASEEPRVAHAILSALDGNTSLASVVARVGEGYRSLADTILAELLAKDLLCHSDQESDEEVGRYLRHFLAWDEKEGVGLTAKVVGIVGHRGSVELMARNLASHEIGVRAEPLRVERAELLIPDVDAMVFLWECPDLYQVERFNEAVCRARIPSLFVDLSHGQHATIGPFYIPSEGSCYHCLRQRLAQNSQSFAEHASAEEWMRRSESPLPSYGLLPTFRYQVVGVAGSELVAFLTRHRPLRTLNRAMNIDLERLETWIEPVWRIPWCDACGGL